MDLFRNYFGAPQPGQVPSGADTSRAVQCAQAKFLEAIRFASNYLAFVQPCVRHFDGIKIKMKSGEKVERLCDRVQSSTLLEDRRDAVRALKSLSKKFRLEVGTQAMEILLQVLRMDRSDAEIMGYALETLCNVLSTEPPEEEEGEVVQAAAYPNNIGQQFSEMFIKSSDNVSLLLDLLQEYDFHVLWPAVRLLTQLLTNSTKDVQEIILANATGISKMMDLLQDSREIIRNDDLLLLIALTKSNTNIQKIVAFENGFERLFDIVRDEGYSDGGVIVEDCLILLLNLLKNNVSNQNFLKEGSYIQRMQPFFDLQQSDRSMNEGWSAQKVSNVHLMLQIIRTLVSPNNPQQQIASCQKVMNQCGLLEKLCMILMASGIPADVLTETINTVAEVIRGSHMNQEYFTSVLAPSNPPRPAIVVLLMSMVNEKQPFILRSAVLYCFQSYLYKNELGQSLIVKTLLPSSSEVNTMTAGQLLCSGLFSQDQLSTWFAAVALLHAIVYNPTQKVELLRVQLATNLGNPPVSLIQQCTNILSQGAKLQTRVGLLMLLCHWLAYCPDAVTHFLHNSANVPYLISQVSASEGDELESIVQGLCAFLLGICVLDNSDKVPSYNTTDLRQMIEKRIGFDQFADKLSKLSKHESYSKAAKKPQLVYKQPEEVLFDFEFTQLFKQLENDVLKSVSPHQSGETDKKRAVEQHESIVEQYKKIIREQDIQLNAARAQLSDVLNRSGDSQQRIEDMTQQIQQLKDQNALLKTQRGSSASLQTDLEEMSRLHRELEESRKQVQEKSQKIDQLTADLLSTESKLALSSDIHTKASDGLSNGSDESGALVDEMRRKLSLQEEEVRMYKGKYEDCSRQLAQVSNGGSAPSPISVDSSTLAVVAENNNLLLRVAELEQKLKRNSSQQGETDVRIEQLKSENNGLLQRIQVLEGEKAELDIEKHQAVTETENIKKEQDDLLVLLTEQETRIKTYRKKLKELGVTIEGDMFEDDDDDDDDNDDDDVEES